MVMVPLCLMVLLFQVNKILCSVVLLLDFDLEKKKNLFQGVNSSFSKCVPKQK